MQIVLVEGSFAVDLEYGHATVYIDDSLEPECGMQILFYIAHHNRDWKECVLPSALHAIDGG